MAGVGLAGGGLVLVYRGGTPLVGAYSAVSMLLSGAFYPVSVLPGSLQAVSALFPLTLFLKVARGAVLAGTPAAWGDLAVLWAWALGGLASGVLAFRWGLREARRRGTLSQY